MRAHTEVVCMEAAAVGAGQIRRSRSGHVFGSEPNKRPKTNGQTGKRANGRANGQTGKQANGQTGKRAAAQPSENNGEQQTGITGELSIHYPNCNARHTDNAAATRMGPKRHEKCSSGATRRLADHPEPERIFTDQTASGYPYRASARHWQCICRGAALAGAAAARNSTGSNLCTASGAD